ncbi:MAG: hypothetical protein JW395_3090 [Nitrospira sp.]|nr:hypothetical protein [Nitrospira sp.]
MAFADTPIGLKRAVQDTTIPQNAISLFIVKTFFSLK